MPFKSKAQMRWAFANKKQHPKEMKNFDPHEWAHETPSLKKLPEHVAKEGQMRKTAGEKCKGCGMGVEACSCSPTKKLAYAAAALDKVGCAALARAEHRNAMKRHGKLRKKADLEGALGQLNAPAAQPLALQAARSSVGDAMGTGAMVGGGLGSLIGYGRGNTAEGLGRGMVSGASTGLGAGLGSALGGAAARGAGLSPKAQVIAALLGLGGGGLAGYGLSQHALGEPAGRREERPAEAKTARFKPFKAKKKGLRRKRAAQITQLLEQAASLSAGQKQAQFTRAAGALAASQSVSAAFQALYPAAGKRACQTAAAGLIKAAALAVR